MNLEHVNPRLSLYGAVVALALGVMVAGTSSGWLVPATRLVSIAAMAVAIGLWLRAILRGLDRTDLASIFLLVAIGVSVVTSVLPRQSAEALYPAFALVAVFGLVRRAAPDARKVLLIAMALVASVVSAVVLISWIGAWVRWIQATGTLPPLSMRLPSAPFGHPHDVALLVGLLGPAVVAVGFRNTKRTSRIASLAVATTVGLIIVMSGSRAVWLAVVVASLVTAVLGGGAYRITAWIRRSWILVAAAAILVVCFAVFGGIGRLIAERALATVTLNMRAALWDSALTSWSARPVTGSGPGIFPFLLQPTGYFDGARFSPAHADNVYVQLLTEVGVLGLVATLIFLASIASKWRKATPPVAAIWAISFVATAGLASNPLALGYCAFIIVIWAGLATPFAGHERTRRMPWMTGSFVAAGCVAAISIVVSTTAFLTFDQARDVAQTKTPRSAEPMVAAAAAQDPRFPLYARTRGALLVGVGRYEQAIESLQIAADLNPRDDAGFRALAIAESYAGRQQDALADANRAISLRGTDALNRATLAYVLSKADDGSRRDALTDLVTLSPWASADPAWATLFPQDDPSTILSAAAATVDSRRLPPDLDPRWVLALAPGAAQSSVAGGLTGPQLAFAMLTDCRVDEATSILGRSRSDEGATWGYWFAEVVLRRLKGQPVDRALEAMIMLSPPVREEGSPLTSPLVDETGYGRLPLEDVGGPELPSRDGGIRAWVNDPSTAIAAVRGAPCS